MTKIAYILLCHKDPEAIIRQASDLTAAGDLVAIHFDGRAPARQFARLQAGLSDNPNVTFAPRRVRCGWGEWSLVQATMLAVEAALAKFPRATHFYMLSGDCGAIKTAEYMHRFLSGNDADFIEAVDFYDSNWIRTGMTEERLHYRHFLNERRHKKLFYASVEAQRRLGLRRSVPEGIRPQIGSQWWCLRRATVETVLAFVKERPDVPRFFRTTWIPDETFFQTLVRHLVPADQIRSRSLTFLMFTDYGMPVTFYNDHHDLLLRQDYLFARKISPEATKLKQELGQLYSREGVSFTISNEGRQLFHFLTARGREGHGFGQRFWEKESTLGRDRELLIVVCKKWHLAQQLARRIGQQTGIPSLGYVFNENSADLPDLGGLEHSLTKRNRHRRAVTRMLFDSFGTDRLLLCVDTSSLDLVHDFVADRSETRILEIESRFSQAELEGHARRIGLASDGAEVDARLRSVLESDIALESTRLREAGFEAFERIFIHAAEGAAGAPDTGDAIRCANRRALARFLSIPEAEATELLADGLRV